jgi:hypothetical protein
MTKVQTSALATEEQIEFLQRTNLSGSQILRKALDRVMENVDPSENYDQSTDIVFEGGQVHVID